MSVDVTVNGDEQTLARDAGLATALRDAGYKGVKCGCDGGTCGASTVLVDGEALMACGTTTDAVGGAKIETIEALGSQGDLHPIQQAFVDHFAVQCGFCIPGMIMQAKALLRDNPDPSEREVRAALDDNVCRCTGYQKPVEAILDAAGRLRGEPPAPTVHRRGVDAREGEASD
jgi:carbon-monoxide dehydrogenase small subunit